MDAAPAVQALAGFRNGTESSNSSRSATQSEVQRNPAGWPWKLPEMGGISRFLLANRTGESPPLIAAGKLCSLFLQRASEQSGFQQLHQANAMRSQKDDKAKAAFFATRLAASLGRLTFARKPCTYCLWINTFGRQAH